MTKVNLIYGEGDVLDTHLNINPFTKNTKDGFLARGELTNLDKYVDAAEVDELVALDVIDYIPTTQTKDALDNWISKLRIGGRIIIGGIDILSISKSISDGSLDTPLANLLIHGKQDKPYLIKRASFSAYDLSEYLESFYSLGIVKKDIINYNMLVEAQRTK
jgi:S-adenosylmethionine:diacylglycerol 3-amino-3-carboxypropyl transferase